MQSFRRHRRRIGAQGLVIHEKPVLLVFRIVVIAKSGVFPSREIHDQAQMLPVLRHMGDACAAAALTVRARARQGKGGALQRCRAGCCLHPAKGGKKKLIIIIAAGLLSSAVNMLQAADIITFWTTPVFDISHILDDQGVFGTFLRALFGYNASPAGLQLLTWAVYLAIFVTLWQRSYRPQVSAASSKG